MAAKPHGSMTPKATHTVRRILQRRMFKLAWLHRRHKRQVCTGGKIMMYLFFWIVMEFALVIGAVQLILKKGGF
jgi:hypothetical protein